VTSQDQAEYYVFDEEDYEPPRRRIQHSSLSLKSLRVHVLDKEHEEIMVATGFLFVAKDYHTEADLSRLALVTNFHVAANRNRDGDWFDLSTRDRYPFFLRVYVPSPFKPDEDNPADDFFEVDLLTGKVGEYRRAWYSKYEAEDGAKPCLLGPEHQVDYPEKISSDIAVIPIPLDIAKKFDLAERAYIWDRRDLEARDLQYELRPTEVVQVIGYPFSAKGFTVSMPIWTSGSVANEVNSGPDDRFLIDARTRPGQSGSPVVLYRAETTAGSPLPVRILEEGLLLGVYSGRTDKVDDLGFVWWGNEIESIYWNIPKTAWR
jgi:hypothetical protein